MKKVRFIDLFAGIGGLRLGFENGFKSLGIKTTCVMTSEIKPYAIDTLHHNFPHDLIVGDITNVPNEEIPDFDFLLGGFPCQPFSAGGKRLGFVDTRGTLFFEIERIIQAKKPFGFILENVEGLVKHDLESPKDKIGRTLATIIFKLEQLGYSVSWEVLNSKYFGSPQSRKRIFIIGTKSDPINLKNFDTKINPLKTILEKGLDPMKNKFTDLLLSHFTVPELYGKSIKDKRGGENNIHSWDIELKGPISHEQNILLNQIFKARRRKKWAEEIGIDWMDGMPLTEQQIQTFYKGENLKALLEDLVLKGYLCFEHPKKLVNERLENGLKTYRTYDETKPKGYNIVAGKLSFEINKILDPEDVAPTLVATDMERLTVPDGDGLRRMTLREGLRMFGYPENFNFPPTIKPREGFDLLGNTVAVPVVTAVATRIAEVYKEYSYIARAVLV